MRRKANDLQVRVSIEGGETWSGSDSAAGLSPKERTQRIKELVRLGIHRALQASYDLAPSPWGTLTGVRPTKLVHSLYDSGCDWTEIAAALDAHYAVSPEKAELLIDVAKRQRRFFAKHLMIPSAFMWAFPFVRPGSYCSFAVTR